MSIPQVSIIIPTRDREALLSECLDRLVPQLPGNGAVEIIISDDSPSPARETIAPALRIAGPRAGPGPNRNFAAGRATGKWLVFIDDDCLPLPGFLNAYLGILNAANEECDFFAGTTIPCGDGADSLLMESPHNLPPGNFPPPSCNFCVSRRFFEASGGFDERYRVSFEDMEFFSRLAALGGNFRFVEGAAVEHEFRPIPSAAKLAARWESRVISCLDHGASPRDIAMLLPRHMALVILSRFRGKPLSPCNVRASATFAFEYFTAIARLPGWISKNLRGPRSSFWKSLPPERHPPRFGL